MTGLDNNFEGSHTQISVFMIFIKFTIENICKSLSLFMYDTNNMLANWM